jgi:hypothetical protein
MGIRRYLARNRLPAENIYMKVARFFNFTNQPFEAHWNGRKKVYAPGTGLFMEAGIAAHHAKHLANKVLIQTGRDTMTSPKFPEQVPDFMELFNQAYTPQEDSEEDQSKDETTTDILNKNRQSRPTPIKTVVDDKPAQIVVAPDAGSDDDEFEEAK